MVFRSMHEETYAALDRNALISSHNGMFKDRDNEQRLREAAVKSIQTAKETHGTAGDLQTNLVSAVPSHIKRPSDTPPSLRRGVCDGKTLLCSMSPHWYLW